MSRAPVPDSEVASGTHGGRAEPNVPDSRSLVRDIRAVLCVTSAGLDPLEPGAVAPARDVLATPDGVAIGVGGEVSPGDLHPLRRRAPVEDDHHGVPALV